MIDKEAFRKSIQEHVRRVVNDAPPLSPEQRDSIARLLTPPTSRFEVSHPTHVRIKP